MSGRPHPGARIETLARLAASRRATVAPTRGRGSKRRLIRSRPPGLRRRPHPGARIETSRPARDGRPWRVAPTRGRGSKRVCGEFHQQQVLSPPPGGADRNLGRNFADDRRPGRPHPGARIETAKNPGHEKARPRRPHPGARIETRTWSVIGPGRPGSPPPGGADRNCGIWRRHDCRLRVAPTRGRGSKRSQGAGDHAADEVAPTRGRGSKLGPPWPDAQRQGGRPHPGARIETAYLSNRTGRSRASPPPGGADRNNIPVFVDPDPGRSPPPGGADRNSGDAGDHQRCVVAPTRGRGSKRAEQGHSRPAEMSPPPGGADRNNIPGATPSGLNRRPHPGARIETSPTF